MLRNIGPNSCFAERKKFCIMWMKGQFWSCRRWERARRGENFPLRRADTFAIAAEYFPSKFKTLKCGFSNRRYFETLLYADAARLPAVLRQQN